jgi:hypothetical protein
MGTLPYPVTCARHISDIPFFSDQHYRKPILKALQKMAQCRWWNRVWVIQELLAPEAVVFFDHIEMPWNVLAQAAVKYESHQTTCYKDIISYLPKKEVEILSQFSRVVQDFVEVRARWNTDSKTHLLQLLRQFRSRKSKDPKDKVFALLGLTNFWGRRRPIVPDYNCSVRQIFREVVREMIGVTNTLSILAGTLNKAGSLPSWIPDWSTPLDPTELQRLQLESLYSAPKNMKPPYRHDG